MKVSGLKSYKDSCYSALSRDLTEFEKNFLLISVGLLAFSITFIKDIIKVSEADYLYLLFVGWSLIIGSVGVMMHTFLQSANDSDKLWRLVDKFMIDNEFHDEASDLSKDQWLAIKKQVDEIFDKSKFGLKRKRNLAVNLFISGTLSFSLFVSLNLLKERNTAISTKQLLKDGTTTKESK